MANQRYVYGTAARKYEQVLPYEEERIKNGKTVQKQKKQKVSFANAIIMIAFAAAVAFTVYTCFRYLSLQAEAVAISDHIASLENEISIVKVQNDAVEYEISGYKDIDYIYQTAVTELGMVEAAKSQISHYVSTENEYMIQSGDIPEE